MSASHPHRAAWTDERLDDLNQTMRDGIARNDREHQEFRQEMRELRADMDRRFDRVDQRFDSLQRMMLIGLFGLVTTTIGSTLGAIIALA